MSGDSRPVNVTILDKEYLVACREGERESLQASVDLLKTKIQEIRDNGKAVGNERIVVLAALNIAHEFLEYKRQKDRYTSSTDASLQRLQDKINKALAKGGLLEIQETV
jgi:cell division protein ZapA